jgi:hypothetical protein
VAPFLYITTLVGVRISTYEFGGREHKHSVHNMEVTRALAILGPEDIDFKLFILLFVI